MKTIQCHIGNRLYRLDYDVTTITSGSVYHGTVYFDHILDFYCEVPDSVDSAPLFFPVSTGPDIRTAVLSAILHAERIESHRGRR